MPTNASSFAPTNQTCEFNKKLILTPKCFLYLLFQPLSNGDKRDDEVRRISGNEVRESSGEDIWSVPNCTATLVYKLKFLFLPQN
jgi:hypothetical protein